VGTEQSERSALAVTRNPLLALPGAVAMQSLPVETRQAMAKALRDIQVDARVRAEKCWRTHKAPMAVYWKAVGVYSGHLARVLSVAPPNDPAPLSAMSQAEAEARGLA
jgi:hypothetical protein